MEIKRAILSVSDKRGIVDLARFLTERDVEVISTGGTAQHLTKASVPVTTIAQWTGAPEILGGRVKTLHPKVFGGILFDRDDERHVFDLDLLMIGAIDLVVVNLYPFEATIAREGVTFAEAVEQIDVGGPSMLRAAAKNHRHVIPLCDPSLYDEFMTYLDRGEIPDAFRRRAAQEVFRRTAEYDSAIAAYLSGAAETLPSRLSLSYNKIQPLRYGENPQQQAAFYTRSGSKNQFDQLHGKELSYNNLLDLDAAFRVATAFEQPAAVVVKHTNPCGAATAPTLAEAMRLAIESDPVAAFGGIVATNRELDATTVEHLAALFLEVIIAPSFSDDALETLGRKKNLRLVRASGFQPGLELRSAAGGLLVQTADQLTPSKGWNCVTTRAPSTEERRALEFAWTIGAYVKSNAIVLACVTESTAEAFQTLGIGAGQMSRVDAAKIAVMKSLHPTRGSVASSDAFFPFRDGLEILAAAGVTAVVQPGGSMRDEEVISTANDRGLAMLFTGERHFRH